MSTPPNAVGKVPTCRIIMRNKTWLAASITYEIAAPAGKKIVLRAFNASTASGASGEFQINRNTLPCTAGTSSTPPIATSQSGYTPLAIAKVYTGAPTLQGTQTLINAITNFAPGLPRTQFEPASAGSEDSRQPPEIQGTETFTFESTGVNTGVSGIIEWTEENLP